MGHGGPWQNTKVNAGQLSDPYLIGFYDEKNLKLSQQSKVPVTVTVEVDPIGNGPWMEYKTFTVKPGQTVSFDFPKGFSARWIRFKTDKDCEATALLEYK